MLKSALIVDDSKFMRLMIKNILIQNRFETIEEAENGLI
ncbi:MAG: two-component system response regulator, partial [archaeon]|nr:two-component system response regulator [archaeon]